MSGPESVGALLAPFFDRGELPLRIQRVGGALCGRVFTWSDEGRGYFDGAGHAAPAFLVREDWGRGWIMAPAVQEVLAL